MNNPLLYFIFISLLILTCFINPVSGLTEYNDTIIFSGNKETIESGSFDAGTTSVIWYTGISFENPENTVSRGVQWYTCSIPYDRVAGIDGEVTPSRWDSVTFKVSGVTVGTGEFGYIYNTDTNKYYIGAFFDDNFDISSYSGFTHVTITGGMSYRFYPTGFPTTRTVGLNNVELDPNAAMCGYNSGGYGLGHRSGSVHSLYTAYSQQFDFTYGLDDYLRYYLNFTHTSGHDASLLIDNGDILYDDTSPLSSHDIIVDTNLSRNSWDFTVENTLSDSYNTILSMAASGPQSAEVNFNQSYFTSPDVVGVVYDIETFDTVNYEYWILLTGTNDGIKYFVTTDYYDITTATGQDNFTISYYPLTLPFTMQAELWHYSRVSGESSILSYSPLVEYNPSSMAPGSIWTEKENYNISEIFYIQIDTNYNTVQIELISSDFYDLRTMEGPGFNYLGYLFNDPHNFTAYLIENGIKTNYTDFSVSADTPFLNIHVDTVPVNQGFCFSYYTDNTSDTITGYRPDGSIFYGPTTNLITLEKVDICGPSSSSPAGIYTMSLLHDGAEYYNDTIVMTSANEYIYFESSKYETGDRMIIHYYIMDSQQRIRLSDSVGTAVVTWTCDAFYITPNMGNSLWFSLIDNNEYGLNMNASIDAGTFRTGNWKVEIIGIDGKPLTDYDTYDYTTVNKKIETSEDQTTAFILLIFSPEGIFLILTSALMLAGLVAAKHPAGGAAGAAVGVGFGVFFGVLPVWMLLLMVILLVVLAGVGTAVYFKGK